MCGSSSDKIDRAFIEDVLKIKYMSSVVGTDGVVNVIASPLKQFKKDDLSYFHQPNSLAYYVHSADVIEPADDTTYSICQYAGNDLSAGVAHTGAYKTCVFGFPLEALTTDKDRAKLIESVLLFFAKK